MSDTTLAVVIKARDELTAGLGSAAGKLDAFAQRGKRASDELESLSKRVGTELKGVGERLGTIASSAISAAGAISGIVAAISVTGFAHFIKSNIDAADRMRDLAIAAGTSVEGLAAHELAARQSDTQIETLSKGMGRLSVFMERNAAEAKRLGLSARDPAQALAQLADALERARTPGVRNAIAMRALGESYQDLMPLLAQGGEELRRQADASRNYASRMAELAEQADKFNDQLAVMKQKGSEVGIAIANHLLPAMNGVLERWSKAIELSDKGYGFFDLILGGISPTGKIESQLAAVNRQIYAINIKLKDIKTNPVQAAMAMYDEKQLQSDLARLTTLKQTLVGFQRDGALAAAREAAGRGNTGKVIDLARRPDKKSTAIAISDAQWAFLENAHLTKTLFEVGQQLADAEAGAFTRAVQAAEEWEAGLERVNKTLAGLRDSLTGDIMEHLGAALANDFADTYGLAYLAVDKTVSELRRRLEAGVNAYTTEQYAQAAEQINAIAHSLYRNADLSAATQSLGDAVAQRQTRLVTIQAELTAGVRTETEARREGIAVSRLAMEEMRTHVDVLSDLANKGFSPAQKALAQFRAEWISIQDAARSKEWSEGIQRGLKDYAGSAVDTFATVRDAAKAVFQGMEDSLVQFVTKGKLDFRSLADSILSDMIRIQLQQSVTKPLAAAMSGFDFGKLFGFAQGGAPGGVSAWRNQVVDRPTFFAFAQGGVMGEAGPEAIMPLRRVNGRLGVDASGMANVQIIVNNNAPGTQATARERNEGGVRMFEVVIEQVKSSIAGDIGRGAGSIPEALADTYGLNRVAGAY